MKFLIKNLQIADIKIEIQFDDGKVLRSNDKGRIPPIIYQYKYWNL